MRRSYTHFWCDYLNELIFRFIPIGLLDSFLFCNNLEQATRGKNRACTGIACPTQAKTPFCSTYLQTDILLEGYSLNQTQFH